MVRRKPAALLLALGFAAAGCAASHADPSVAYLQQAQTAARARNGAATLVALDQAESAWLGVYRQSGTPCMNYNAEGLRAIGSARVSVQQANWRDATYYISTAIQNAGPAG